MDRRKFLINLGLATASISVASQLLTSEERPTQDDVLEAIKAQLGDTAKYKPNVIIGWENDDFLNNLITVYVDGKKAKIKV